MEKRYGTPGGLLARQQDEGECVLEQTRLILSMFVVFFKIGAFTFGGGYAMVPLMQKEVVDANGWVTNEEFLDMLGLAQTAPGPIAVNTSVFVGYRKAGLAGAIAAVAGTTLPSFLVILAIAMFFGQLRGSADAEAAFSGVRPAVVALVAGAAFRIGRAAVRDVCAAALCALAFTAIVALKVHPIPVIVGCAALGCVLFRGTSATASQGPGPSLPTDDSRVAEPDATDSRVDLSQADRERR